jgi:imidazolonepropionase-like amidohydrolase
MAVAAIMRDTLAKAQEYMRKCDRAVSDEDEDGPEFDSKMEALIPLLRGEITAHFHAHRADDMFTAVRIAKEFGLKYAIVHATEAHLVTDILRAEGAPLITGPALRRSKPEL